MRRSAGVLAFAITVATFGSACGLRTPVRPPEDTAPVIPGDVEARREESGAVLVRWRRAERSADGERLDDLARFHVERRRDGEDTWQRIGTTDVFDQEKIRRRRDFSYRDADAGSGTVYYRVIAETEDGQEGVPTDAVAATIPSSDDAPAVSQPPAAP